MRPDQGTDEDRSGDASVRRVHHDADMRPLARTGATIALTALLALVLHAALAAGGVVSGSDAGAGQQPVSGYVVEDVRWALAPGDPALVEAVRLRLDRAARTVRVRVDASAWSACSIAGLEVSCPLPVPLPLAATSSLAVAAAG